MATWKSLLEELRRGLGDTPRKFSWKEWWYQRIPNPRWNRDVFSGWDAIRFWQHRRLRRGKIVWGSFVQFSGDLKQPGKHGGCGHVVFSFDPQFEASPYALVPLAHRLHSMAEEPPVAPDHEHAELRRHLLFDYRARRPCVVPHSMTGGKRVYLTPVMIARRHLPLGCIVNPVVPLAADPRRAHATLVPVRYWPRQLRFRLVRLYSGSHNWRKWFHVS